MKNINLDYVMVLDASSGLAKLIAVKKGLQSEEIEEIISDKYEFRLKDCDWMVVKEIDIDILF